MKITNFEQFETTRSFGDNIHTGKTSIDEAKTNQSNLLESMIEFNNKTRLKKEEMLENKKYFGYYRCSL